MGKMVLATIVGLVVAVLFVMVGEAIGHRLFPPPPGIDVSKTEDLARLMSTIPLGAKIAVLVSWFAATVAGCAVARKMSPSEWPSRIVLAFMLGSAIWSYVYIPHPLWMMVAGLGLPLVAYGLAQRRVRA